MSKRVVSVPRSPGPGLDLVSHGRSGPSARRLSPEQVEQVTRTVRRTPEVMVKVSGGARDVGGAKAHFRYIDRHGKLSVETDEGHALDGRSVAGDLVADWNLDLCRGQYRSQGAGRRDPRPKLTHHIVLSMPAPTPADAVLKAARRFARENFALQHRYALVLHTDQKHPHVHLVVKAEHETEPGRRLNIDKARLRRWREEFAAALREQGVAANATRAVQRGARKARKDPIHRRLRASAEYQSLPASVQTLRKPPRPSTFMRAKVEGVLRQMLQGGWTPGTGQARLERTREEVLAGWQETADALRAQGLETLAREVERFMTSMPPPRTDQAAIAAGLASLLRNQSVRQGAGDDQRPPPDRPG